MNDLASRQISDAEGKLSLLLREIKGSPVEARVQMWIQRMCSNRKLSEYLNDDRVSPKDRITVARGLIDILLTKEYGRLPEIASPTNFSSVAVGSATTDAAKACAPVDRAGNRNQGHSGETETTLADQTDLPPPDDLRAIVRAEVRRELAELFELVAKCLRQ